VFRTVRMSRIFSTSYSS